MSTPADEKLRRRIAQACLPQSGHADVPAQSVGVSDDRPGLLSLADIRVEWPHVREGLEQVRALCDEAWRVEDVYAACVNGGAFLYTARDGFVILQPLKDDYRGDTYLHIWIAWGDGRDMVDRYAREIDRIAAMNQYERITFSSPRKGWERHVPEGWAVKKVVYEREVAV